MKTIRYARTLVFHDRPLVIEAEDGEGGRYLCDSLATREDGEWFIVVPVTDEEAGVLNRGEACMRQMMERVGCEEWYLSVPHWDFREPFGIVRQEGAIGESRKLPGEGYMLTGAWDEEEQGE